MASEDTTTATTISGDYQLDPTHTRVGFSARHAMVTKVRGQFQQFEGTAHIDHETPANSSVSVTVQVSSLDTGVADRDAHLKSEDFFAVDEWPTITFTSTEVTREGGTWQVAGDLTIKDVTKSLTIEFQETGTAVDPWGNKRVGFEGGVTISRKDWGLTWNVALEAGGILVSDQVNLEFDISAIPVA
jgi:polyisoprenoid-binding protein YceI